MWSPTHVEVLVKRARGLKIKGKNGTNDCFVTIAMAKEKYQTSVKEKSGADVEWCEQCELAIPEKKKAEICLTALHR
jgi:Rab11 family-interacting protein 1/2/5